MNNLFQKFVLIFAVSSLLLGGCTRIDNTELLTAEPWKLTSLTSEDVDPLIVGLEQVFLSLGTVDYMADGTFTITTTDSTITAEGGTWMFNDDETQLLQTQTGEPTETLDIVTLDEDNLVYTFSDSLGTRTATWGH